MYRVELAKAARRWRTWLLAVALSSTAAAQTVGRAAEVPTLTEGPTVDREGNLYFSELRFRRIFKVDVKGELSVYREDSRGANGLLVDPTGLLKHPPRAIH